MPAHGHTQYPAQIHMFVIQLKSFFMVARLGSITLAAKHLGLSQPTVTTQIRALEEHYGIELFRRQGGRLVVSDDGVRLLPMVEALMQQESNVEFALRNAGDVNQGQLRLGTTAPYYILDIVKRFQDRYPRVDVVITMGKSRQTGEALREFRVDLATTSHKDEDARLLRLHLGADPLALVLHTRIRSPESDPFAWRSWRVASSSCASRVR